MNMFLCLLAFVSSAVACLLLARWAPTLRLVDLPDERKRHAAPIPLVGGIAVLLGFLLATLAAGQLAGLHEVAGPMALIFVVGLVDDARNLSAKLKLVVQIFAAWWLVHATGAALYAMPIPFLTGHLDLGWAAVPLTVLMVVAILNAINMIDGLDGLAGGCIAIAVASLGAAAGLSGRHDLALIAALLCSAVLGFLLWNARLPWQARARVFLGDAGALAVGMLLCWLILKLSLSWQGFSIARVPLTVVLAPVAVPVIDLIVVAFWRAAEGRNPMQADRGHSHHLLLEMGLTTVAAVRLIWLAAAIIAAATFVAWRFGVAEGRLLGVLVAASLAYLVWFRLSWLKVRRGLLPSPPAPLPCALSPNSSPASGRGELEAASPEAKLEGSGECRYATAVRKRVLFVTTGLGVGGAERALERLLPRLQAQGLVVAVLSLREPQEVGVSLRALGIEVFELGMAPSRPTLGGLWRLWRAVRQFKPDVIQGWMYHGDLAAHLARFAAPRAKVVLGIHQTLARLELESRATRAVIRADAWLSRFAARALYVARAAQLQHEAAGFAAPGVVLPNGVDTEQFKPDAALHAASRALLGVAVDELLVGMVGRLHPSKNHAGFLRAAAMVAAAQANVRFLLIGLNVSADNPELMPLLAAPSLQGRVILLGPREDVPQLLPALDLYVLSSIQEALPNVVAEAMSCGVPCVVTDVGDAAWMVGETGWVVPPAEDRRLADLIGQVLCEEPSVLARQGMAARSRAQSVFAADAVAARYADLYASF
ncbi:hypothetical protein GCM10027046_19370 [Uliginosibacterium flavum]|uniref:Glycosyltransferase n=1 Tax=Uliginosibacterium flavum TaxID=1396831 RepID=A0ABV2TFT0_9RHOO